MIAQRRARRRIRQQLTGLFVIVVLLAAAVGFGLYIGLKHNPHERQKQPGTPAAPADPVETMANTSPQVPIVQAERLTPPTWRKVDELFIRPDVIARAVEVRDGLFVPAGPDSQTYFARLVMRSEQLIELANLHLLLIDANHRVFARAEVPLALIGGAMAIGDSTDDDSGAIRIDVPRELSARQVEVASRVDVILTMRDGVRISKLLATPMGEGTKASVKIIAFNPTPRPLRRAIFDLRAMGFQGETLGRWRVNWTDTVAARQRVEFIAMTPLNSEWNVKEWKVLGAAEPEPDYGTVAPRKATTTDASRESMTHDTSTGGMTESGGSDP